MEQFKLSPAAIKELVKKTYIKVIPIVLIAATGGIVISESNRQDDVNILPVLIPVMLCVLGFSFYRGIKMQRDLFESYRLIFDNERIIREQFNTTAIIIMYTEVTEITKDAKGNFNIKGKSKNDLIIIPTIVEDPVRLESILTEIKPITIKGSESFFKRNSWLTALVTIGLMLAVYVSNNKLLVGSSGVLLLVLMTYSFISIQRNKSIDRKTKSRTWFLIIVVISVAIVMASKLMVR
ncbi:MAG TPA: hypothetical protein VFF27_02235 [Bacteroidia bacterium]|jgi:hypothetical protein|nr:hypothetical protein [Bacteroidia bacterium]